MSIFWLGGPQVIVPDDQIRPEMYEDMYFLPGVIHGGKDYLIRVYLNDVCEKGEPEEFTVEYITKELILKAYEEDPSLEGTFYQTLACEAEQFGCYNDASGDFAALIEAWPKAVYLPKSQLVAWAKGEYAPPVREKGSASKMHIVKQSKSADLRKRTYPCRKEA